MSDGPTIYTPLPGPRPRMVPVSLTELRDLVDAGGFTTDDLTGFPTIAAAIGDDYTIGG